MANRFWVGGTATWDNTSTANWSTTSGGASGASVPGSADIAVFDSNSGAAVVTADSSLNGITLGGITFTGTGGFEGTLDFATNNPSLTITGSFSVTGSGIRTVNLGSGTFTLTGVNTNNWDATTVTNLTLDAGTSTIALTTGGAQGQTFAGGGKTYSTLSIGARSQIGRVNITGSNTFANLNISPTVVVGFAGATTTTITNAINWVGSSSALFYVDNSSSGSAATLSLSASPTAVQWGAFKGLTFSGVGSGFTATSSFNLGGVSGATISGPSTSSGARIIGG